MSFQIRVVMIADNSQEQMHEIMSLQRTELKPETLGLTLAEGKAILREIQRVVVEHQIAECVAAHQHCSACGQPRHSKGHHDLPLRTVFGKITIPSPRFVHCDCQPHETKSFSPLAQALPERTTPELLFLETKWSSLMSYGLTAETFAGGPADGLAAACVYDSRARVSRGPTAGERIGRGAVVFCRRMPAGLEQAATAEWSTDSGH
jgi:hypothetical protein